MAHIFEAGIPWSRPTEVWIDRRTHLERKKTGGLFHGSWGFTREAFLSVSGYPAMQSGQDQALAERFKRAAIRAVSPSDIARTGSASAAPTSGPSGLPSYIYRWHTYPGARHISTLGKDGYERRGQEVIEPVTQVIPAWSRDWCVMVPG